MTEIKWGFERTPANDRSLLTRKKVREIGINDAWYVTKLNGIRCPAYTAWSSMMTRCYKLKYHEDHPTYIDTYVCEEWLTFSNFLKWFDDNYIEGYQLDKDIIGDNKMYSPKTCIFIPGWLNKFITAHNSARGEHPIGVSWDKQREKFKSYCSDPFTGKQVTLGLFNDSNSAYSAWLKMKLKHCLTMKPELDKLSPVLYESLIQKIKNLK